MISVLMAALVATLAFGQPQSYSAADLSARPKVRVVKRKKAPPHPPAPRPAHSARAIDPVQPVQPVQPPPPEMEWGGEVMYVGRTDLADQVSPRSYNHLIRGEYGFRHNPSMISLLASVSLNYETVGERRSEVLLDSDRAELFVSNVQLEAGKSWSLTENGMLQLNLANEFPTSPEARRDQYASVTSGEVLAAYSVWPKVLTLLGRGEIYYIWNGSRYSLSTGETNKTYGTRGTLIVKGSIWQGAFVEGQLGTQFSQYTDGSGEVTYRNSVGGGYEWGWGSVALLMSNGTYLDQTDANVWFVDEYRRILSLRVRLMF